MLLAKWTSCSSPLTIHVARNQVFMPFAVRPTAQHLQTFKFSICLVLACNDQLLWDRFWKPLAKTAGLQGDKLRKHTNNTTEHESPLHMPNSLLRLRAAFKFIIRSCAKPYSWTTKRNGLKGNSSRCTIGNNKYGKPTGCTSKTSAFLQTRSNFLAFAYPAV